MSTQRYYLESVGFNYISLKNSPKRCVQWNELKDSSPSLQYEDSKPYVEVELEARVEGNCRISLPGGQVIPFSEGRGLNKVFKFKVFAPGATYIVNGPGFQDQLVFEVLVSRPTELGFFSFFESSKIRFDLSFAKFSTGNPNFANSTNSTLMFPVMSGLITVPFPWMSQLMVGFSLSQNLSNLFANETGLQFTEYSFDLRYAFKNLFSDFDTLDAIVEFRGRNWFQTGSINPFIIRSSPGPGFALSYNAWLSSASPWGYTLIGNYGLRSAVGAKSNGEIRATVSVNYRLSKKWALGVGYKHINVGVDFSDSLTQSELGSVREVAHMGMLSLILLNEVGQ